MLNGIYFRNVILNIDFGECVWSRDAAMQEGLKRAVGVPLALAERIHVLWPPLKEMVLYGNIACKSDAQVRSFHVITTFVISTTTYNCLLYLSLWHNYKNVQKTISLQADVIIIIIS